MKTYIRSEKHKAILRANAGNRLGKFANEQKKCTICLQVKSVSEFHKRGGEVNGFKSHCIQCESMYAKKLYEKHKIKRLQRQCEYREQNLESVRKRKREDIARYRAIDPERFRISRNTANAKRGTAITDAGDKFSKDDLFEVGEYQGWKCAACHCDVTHSYHIDHIWPLSKNGLNSKDNIQLLCRTCNLSKGSKTPLEFMTKRIHHG